ncbi:uncharacterized protein LOC109841166 isoform X1 [Asparagus officinalis]|uniref:uncharacterized protein LOC109841166 isoform X1 n=1 Tax=Asparagus officinalis TaxID=4686 RepID=UPI00098E60DD|nr:uncharacterized protein LOC109841166 isoform X1 [Asparagus officinalis]
MFVEIPGLGFEGEKGVKGRRLTRTNSRIVARIDPSIEPCAESIPSRPADPDEARPCKRQKMTLRRRVTSSIPNAEPLGDVPIIGGEGHDEDSMRYNSPSPDLDFFGGSCFAPPIDEAVNQDLTGIETDTTPGAGEGIVVGSDSPMVVANPGTSIIGSTTFRWQSRVLNDSELVSPLIAYMLLALLEKLQEAIIDVGVEEQAVITEDVSMEGSNDTNTFHHVADAPPSDPIRDPSGSEDRLLDEMLLEQTRRDATEPVIEAVEPIIGAGSSVGTIIETQSSVAQTQHTTLATEVTTAAAGIYPAEQIARPTKEVGTSATITSAITSTTHTSVQGVSNAECQTREPSVVIGLSTQLYDLVTTLLSNNDPDKILLLMEIRSFFSFVNEMVDNLLRNGLSISLFRSYLDKQVTLLRSQGYSDLADIITADLVCLECELAKLKGFQAAGVSSYVDAQMEAKLQAWLEAQISVDSKIREAEALVHQMEAAYAGRSTTLYNIDSSLASGDATIARLEQELKAAKDAQAALKITRVHAERAREETSGQLTLTKEKLATAKAEAVKVLAADEDSMKITIRSELEQAYTVELSKLEQQVLSHKLHVD